MPNDKSPYGLKTIKALRLGRNGKKLSAERSDYNLPIWIL